MNVPGVRFIKSCRLTLSSAWFILLLRRTQSVSWFYFGLTLQSSGFQHRFAWKTWIWNVRKKNTIANTFPQSDVMWRETGFLRLMLSLKDNPCGGRSPSFGRFISIAIALVVVRVSPLLQVFLSFIGHLCFHFERSICSSSLLLRAQLRVSAVLNLVLQ